jgi:5,6-dimethylbenzimidazole synthase
VIPLGPSAASTRPRRAYRTVRSVTKPDDPAILDSDAVGAFAEPARRAVYDAIALRRDVRHFRPDPVDDAMLERVLAAAHAAPCVGQSQPWRFIVIRDRERRARIREAVLRVRLAEAARFAGERRDAYQALKLEGILDAPLNLCVVSDERGTAPVLGTTAQPETLRASVYGAIQNLWLAARVEGLGVGWVSLIDPEILRIELALPAGVTPIAYLCVGHPVAFRSRPMLEEVKWSSRLPLTAVVHHERFER